MCPDVGALSQLVTSCLDPTAGVTLPPVDGAAEPSDEGITPHPHRPVSVWVLLVFTLLSLTPVCWFWFQFYLRLTLSTRMSPCWPVGELRKPTLSRPMRRKKELALPPLVLMDQWEQILL